MRLRDLPLVHLGDLVDRYEALLFDAYGVLVHLDGPLPGAREAIAHLNAIGKPYLIVSNDAARTGASAAARYQGFGLAIPEDRVVSSGVVLRSYLAAEGLTGLRCMVIGPPDSQTLVREAGAEVVPAEDGVDADALVLCDEAGPPLLPAMDAALTLALRRAEAGRPLRLLLPNPDLIYLRGHGQFGLTAGSLALIIEAALAQRHPGRSDLTFLRLGKPYPAIFEEALRRAGTRRAVMVGDQLGTDIAGARGVGLDAVLSATGLTVIDDTPVPADAVPIGVLPGL
jgi:HAD superfamily hydrolase (TIGR01450 family)